MGKKKPFTDQHIVPVSYLKRFAQRGNSADIIGVVSKDGNYFTESINNVGFIKNYYDIKFLDDIKYWEHYFDKNIESTCCKPMDDLIERVLTSSDSDVVLNCHDKDILSRFIIIQLFRVPDFIDYHINKFKNDIEKYKIRLMEKHYFLRNYTEQVQKADFTEDELKDIILSSFGTEERLTLYCSILKEKQWIIFVNNSCHPFCTGDNPVVMLNMENNSISRGDNGIANENTIIYFPLNPHIALGIYPLHLFDRLIEYDCKKKQLNKKEICIIDEMNEAVKKQCYKQYYIPIDYYKQIFEGENHGRH